MKKYFKHLKETLLYLAVFCLVMVAIILPCVSLGVVLTCGLWWLIPLEIIVEVAIIPLMKGLSDELDPSDRGNNGFGSTGR